MTNNGEIVKDRMLLLGEIVDQNPEEQNEPRNDDDSKRYEDPWHSKDCNHSSKISTRKATG